MELIYLFFIATTNISYYLTLKIHKLYKEWHTRNSHHIQNIDHICIKFKNYS